MIVVPVEKRIDWKRPPIVLIALVVLNLLVFAFYQSGDSELIEDAVQIYQTQGLLEIELRAYRAYLRKTDPSAVLEDDDPYLAWYIVGDPGFDKFVNDHQRRYIQASNRSKWKRARLRIKDVTDKISSNALGLDPNNVTILTLFTHQFLHGGFDHILGNLVFLILTGFAVEAALGSKRFLAYYLITGVGGGLLFALIQKASGGSSASLIGASGAISGVMAMYVMLFGLRKIEFFYWLFIFTGYFRAAAILMLPAYILKELAMLFFGQASNVAYTAHIGGFLAGAVLVYLTQSVSKTAIDDDYLDDNDEKQDPYSVSLQKLYNEIGRGEFKRAWQLLGPLKQQKRNNPGLIEIEYNLINALNAKKADDYLMQRLGKPGNSRVMLDNQMERWHRMKDEERTELSFDQKGGLLTNALDFRRPDLAEKVFKMMKSEAGRESELSVFARKIAMSLKELGRDRQAEEYDEQARHLLRVQHSSSGAD